MIYKQDIETISHLFWECNITKKFILQIQNSMLNDKIRITKQLFLFGSNDVTLKDYNYMFLYAKYFIFTIKDKTSILCLPSFCIMMQQIKNTENIIMSTKDKNYVSIYKQMEASPNELKSDLDLLMNIAILDMLLII